MLDIENFQLKRVSEEDGNGVFSIGPLPRGYGYTLANSVRRIMLASLTGAAITSVKIEGVDHEYSTLEGMQDDILTFILKLKGVVFKSFSDQPVRVKLNVSAPKGKNKVITANDIEADASLEIINKDYEITTLTDGAKLSAELVVEKARGYRSSEFSDRSEIGLLPVDAIFSPVQNVKIKISNARVGQRTDYDQIRLEITTDESITPTEALQETFSIYNNITERFVELVAGDMTGHTEEEVEIVDEEETDAESESAVSVNDIEMSTRLKNALTNSAITDLRVLDGKTEDELLEIRGMGQKSVEELIEIMKDNNLTILQ